MNTAQKVIVALGLGLLLPSTTALIATEDPSTAFDDAISAWTYLVIAWTLLCIALFSGRR